MREREGGRRKRRTSVPDEVLCPEIIDRDYLDPLYVHRSLEHPCDPDAIPFCKHSPLYRHGPNHPRPLPAHSLPFERLEQLIALLDRVERRCSVEVRRGKVVQEAGSEGEGEKGAGDMA